MWSACPGWIPDPRGSTDRARRLAAHSRRIAAARGGPLAATLPGELSDYCEVTATCAATSSIFSDGIEPAAPVASSWTLWTITSVSE